MTLHQKTKTLLSEINALSGNTLRRAIDLGNLLEIADQHSQHQLLDGLAFSSKFIVKSFELMQRIGKDGNGYEKIAEEFTAQIKKSQEVLSQMLEKADPMMKAHFFGTYLEMNTLTLENLMKLYHDLSWYKNYQIDHAI
ncbi:MAG: hypothetical protein WCX28_11750 [Bacteriovoracaceae bacterium]|nr:hypothetical protein [Bacteroidota bacterium]